MRSTSTALAAVAAATALALGGCAASGAPDGSATEDSSGAAHVNVTLTGDGGTDTCRLSTDSVDAGPVTFTVENTSSTAITEVELQSKKRILGEKENLAPGLAPVSFTLTLDGGKYQVYCPGAKEELQTLTVTGSTGDTETGGVQAVLAKGTKGYAKYVDMTVADMVTAVGELQKAVASGDIAAAKKAYALARPYYERIESDVDGFVLDGFAPTDNSGNLDYLIDMRASNLDPAVGWHGFHAIERDLWKRGAITAQTEDYAAELTKNVGRLSELVPGLDYRPEDLANGAAGLLEEVQSGKITGEEEAYSHLDLLDIAANVEGARQAFAFLKPGLKKIDAKLADRISGQFDNVEALLEKYRDPSVAGGYEIYTPAVKESDASTLSHTVQALQDPLATIAEKVATAR